MSTQNFRLLFYFKIKSSVVNPIKNYARKLLLHSRNIAYFLVNMTLE